MGEAQKRTRDRAGRGSLHYAALEGDEAEVRRLIAAGEDVNEREDAEFTPLHFAAQSHAVGAARALLEHGADIEAENRFGNSPLLVALAHSAGRLDLVTLLLEAGADPGHANRFGHTPAEVAIDSDKPALRALFAGRR